MMSEREAQVITAVSNLQRKDLANIEKALPFNKILTPTGKHKTPISGYKI